MKSRSLFVQASTLSAPAKLLLGVSAILLSACGDVSSALDVPEADAAAVEIAPNSGVGTQSAALGAGCATLCNNRRLASEAVCDEFYNPNTNPGHNSACISFVFDEYLDCVGHCGLQPVQNQNFSILFDRTNDEEQDVVVP